MVVDTVVTVVVVVMVVEDAVVVVAVVMTPQRVMIPVRETMTTRGMESQKVRAGQTRPRAYAIDVT